MNNPIPINPLSVIFTSHIHSREIPTLWEHHTICSATAYSKYTSDFAVESTANSLLYYWRESFYLLLIFKTNDNYNTNSNGGKYHPVCIWLPIRLGEMFYFPLAAIRFPLFQFFAICNSLLIALLFAPTPCYRTDVPSLFLCSSFSVFPVQFTSCSHHCFNSVCLFSAYVLFT